MRLKLIVAAALCAIPSLAPANQLVDIYELAVRNDAQLQAAQFQRDASLEAHPQARSALLPQISGAYDHVEGDSDGVSSPRIPNEDGVLVSAPDPYDISSTSDTLSLTLNQTLFDWGAIQALKQSHGQVALAQATYRLAEQDLLLRVAQAYFNVLYGADNLQFADAQKEAVARQLEQAHKRFEVGLSAITDVQEAQASYDLTVAEVILAQQNLEAATEALVEIVGRQYGAPTPLQADIPLPAPNPANVQDWISAARDGNLSLVTYQLQVDISERDIRIARAGHLPTVSFQTDYSDSTSETTGSQESDNESKGTSYGINVRVPIFTGGLTRSRVRQASFTYEQRLAELDASLRSVERSTRDAYLGVIAGASRVRALKQAVISNQTALEASEAGLQVGTRTAVDVLQAQSQLFSAQRDYARARYDYLLAVLQLKSTSGRLGPSDLTEIDALLVSG